MKIILDQQNRTSNPSVQHYENTSDILGKRDSRMDAAIDAMTREMGFDERLVYRVRGSPDQGWPFIEEFSYKLLIEQLLEKQEDGAENRDAAPQGDAAPLDDAAPPDNAVPPDDAAPLGAVDSKLQTQDACDSTSQNNGLIHALLIKTTESSSAAANKAWITIRRLQDAIVSKDVSSTILVDALSSLGVLRSIFHAYNRSIAEAEDNLAQAFCSVRELQPAMEHCKASIEIVEKLYNPNHNVMGYELVKLSSIQLSLGDCAAVDSINRPCDIFSCYYGS
ncbi:hypothetical protein ACE6H2_008770 [Prunus campanulata]